MGLFSNLWEGIKSGVSRIGGFLNDTLIKPIFQPSQANLMKASENLQWLGSKIGDVTGAIKSGLATISKIPVIGGLASAAQTALSPAIGIAETVGGGLKTVGGAIQGGLKAPT